MIKTSSSSFTIIGFVLTTSTTSHFEERELPCCLRTSCSLMSFSYPCTSLCGFATFVIIHRGESGSRFFYKQDMAKQACCVLSKKNATQYFSWGIILVRHGRPSISFLWFSCGAPRPVMSIFFVRYCNLSDTSDASECRIRLNLILYSISHQEISTNLRFILLQLLDSRLWGW